MKTLITVLLFGFAIEFTLNAHAEDKPNQNSCTQAEVTTVIAKQNCSPYSEDVRMCSTTFEILAEPKNQTCGLVGQKIQETSHFKGGYPDGLAGGFRFDGKLGEKWKIRVCKNEQNQKWSWCYDGPGIKTGTRVP